MTRIASAILSLALFGVVPQASALTIIDTIQGTPFGFASGLAVVNTQALQQSVALPFSSASAATITDVTTFIRINGIGGGSVDLGLMGDSNGLPSGTFLFHETVPVGNSPMILSSLNWPIPGGTTFWLAAVATPGSDGIIWQGSGNLTGPSAFTSGGTWKLSSLSALPEALISADRVVDVVTPLPAALPLFATGLGALGLLGWRRKRKAI
jgi:hypothetical protein